MTEPENTSSVALIMLRAEVSEVSESAVVCSYSLAKTERHPGSQFPCREVKLMETARHKRTVKRLIQVRRQFEKCSLDSNRCAQV